MYIHTYMNIYIRTYIHTYIHRYIHIYIYIYVQAGGKDNDDNDGDDDDDDDDDGQMQTDKHMQYNRKPPNYQTYQDAAPGATARVPRRILIDLMLWYLLRSVVRGVALRDQPRTT